MELDDSDESNGIYVAGPFLIHFSLRPYAMGDDRLS